ncbi:MAG: InlB B-repeat-containing protein [Lachnospiraceae bacterium]|nr:InlB B-repeat-containing protein [Lachnospiraceae bacterium]
MKKNNFLRRYSPFLTIVLCTFFLSGIISVPTALAASTESEASLTPTVSPVVSPSDSLMVSPTESPSETLGLSPTAIPSDTPSISPEGEPSELPTVTPGPTPTPVIRTLTFYDSDGKTVIAPAIQRAKGTKWGTLPTPQKNGYTFEGWYNVNGGAYYPTNCTYTVKKDVALKAKWTLTTYKITYHLKGGNFTSTTTPTSSYNITSAKITLPTPVRKKYLFKGWYTASNYTGKKYSNISTGSYGDVNFYAKWQSAAPAKVNKIKLTNRSNQLIVKLTKVSGAKGYEVKISTNKNFKKNTYTFDLGKKNTLTITQPSKKTYYVKARAFAYDSIGNKVYNSYGKTFKIKVTKVSKAVTATSTSAKITSAKALSSEQIRIKATVKKRVNSSDDFYYLVKLNPSTNKVEKSIKKVFKAKSLSITLPIDSAGNNTGNLFSKYAIAIKKSGKYKVISKPSYITNPKDSAYNTMKYIQPVSKKGIQGSTIDSLGTKHTLFNIDLKHVISTPGVGEPYVYNGKTYYFVPYNEGNVRLKNSQGISVSMVILLSWDENLKYLIHPAARVPGKNYYTLNTQDKEARETLEAVFSYLGEKFGQKDCYVSNWILGNELNAHDPWNYAGNLSLSDYTKSYAQAFQMLYYGVKHGYKNARVFISLDHQWNTASNGFSSRDFLTSFASAIKTENPNVEWNIAFHAYPSPLTSADFWRNQNVNNTIDTPYITPLNIEVLTNYVKKTYGKNTRIILSEQGFTSTAGESIQAAALAYAYYKCEFNSMIDAFIIRSEYDDFAEVQAGLSMGLIRTTDWRNKEAFYVYKYMDTPQSENYTNKYLPTIGASSWKSIVPGYKLSKLKSMPNSKY